MWSLSGPAATSVYPEHLRDQIDAHLESLRFKSVTSATEGLEEAMRYSLLAGGKRIRPVLVLATADAVGTGGERVLPLAAAIELIHTYSLIHDDLPAMDDDDLRRGRPTCHVKYGEDVAILAGDALYAEAFRHLLTDQQGDPASVLAVGRELAAATGVDGMVGGQYIDVADADVDLRTLHRLKTGRLICAAVTCTLHLTEVDEEHCAAWRGFAEELGVLFQIVDDVLDVTGTDEDLGKPQGSDERHGKRTFVTEYGLEGAKDLARRSHEEARAMLSTAAPGGAPELEQITDFILTRTT
jgi:geranylgeranyl diphosphate synthase type II